MQAHVHALSACMRHVFSAHGMAFLHCLNTFSVQPQKVGRLLCKIQCSCNLALIMKAINMFSLLLTTALTHSHTSKNWRSLINLWHSGLTQATNLTVSDGCLPRLPLTIPPPPTIRCSSPDGDTNNSSVTCTFQIGLLFIFSPISSQFWKAQIPCRTVLATSCASVVLGQ